MPVSAVTLRKLLDAGLHGDALIAVVESFDADQENANGRWRTPNALSCAKYRAKKVEAAANMSSNMSYDMSSRHEKENTPTPPKEKEPPIKEKPPKGGKKKKIPLPDDWSASEQLRAYGLGCGLSESQVSKSLENLRIWAKANAALKADWDATAQGFFRRDAERLGLQPPVNGAGHGATGPAGFYAMRETPQFEAWDDHFRKAEGRRAQVDRAGGWWFTSEWPLSDADVARALERRTG